ncbi:DUF5309 domain-containing protein [Bradyrhizobium uaiense]|uniref:Head protein n=1 Tax=Bradyrhizobium uaiense TaxID=2594946 RepID=A0A6P1B8E5_9BRAD|nr:DUF5309 domain-containing protein [Bradyrhizobium uaiense]NEU94807.1 head protein [Bradyrhizobium uaiense]
MSTPTNTFGTGTAVGNREDLSDMIYRIDPTDTPFMSAIDKTKASAVNHEWQTQALSQPDNNNAQLEGDDPETNNAPPTVRLSNVAQISYKVARVSGTQQAVDHAGRDNELAYQEMLRGLELKRDLEYILLGNQAKSTGNYVGAIPTPGSPNAPRYTASVLSWIMTNTWKNSAAGGADPTAADGTGTRTDGTQVAFRENQLKGVLASIWTNGGKPNIIMTGSFNKQVFSTFTGRATTVQESKNKTIQASVDAYESDFGKLKVVANRFLRKDANNNVGRDTLVLETGKWAVAYLNGRNMISIPLAKTGDSDRRQILAEYALEARNEKASGGVFDLTAA